jgi:hypothetical protein
MKKRRHKPHYLVFTICLIAQIAHGQTNAFIRDTAYIYLCRGSLENGQPVVTYVVNKNLSTLSKLQTDNQDAAICSFFQNSILFAEPYLTVHNHTLYHFDDSKGMDRFYRNLSALSKSYIDFKTRKFSNGRRITLSITKLIGEFWIVELNNSDYPFSESFAIDKSCYDHQFIYYLKQIDKCIPLVDVEKKKISLALGNVTK